MSSCLNDYNHPVYLDLARFTYLHELEEDQYLMLLEKFLYSFKGCVTGYRIIYCQRGL